MFFEKSDISAILLDVVELDQRNVNKINTERNFSALSFRISADATLASPNKLLHATDNSVLFAPANLDYTRRAKYDRLIAVHFTVGNYYFDEMEILKLKDPERISGLFGSILDCWRKKDVGYHYTATAIFNEILSECHKECYIPSKSESKISRSVKYLEEHYTESDITVSKISGQSFMSEVYFRKLFKEEYGTSPVKYISRLRIQKAISLMAQNYYSLKEVALLSGYSDYAYFSEDFKKHKGVSPSEYFYNYCENITKQ